MEQHHLLTLWDLLPPELQDYIYRLSVCQLKFAVMCRIRWRKYQTDPWLQKLRKEVFSYKTWNISILEEGCYSLGFAN